ncbi:MAG: hypothetical protein ACE5F6_20385 [Anaerolineae bacterium]
MTERLLSKVRRLRQSDETWLCTARRAPTWIMPDDQPAYRPYVVLVVVQASEFIRRTEIKDERPTPDVVLEELLNAMRTSLPRMLVGFGRRRRPARIVLDDADLVQALAPRLAEIDVGCEYRARLPLVDATLREMEAHMNKRDPIPGLLSVPGATQPLVEEFFAAAAGFYRQSPWDWIDNADPIEVRYPADGRARYALVLGSGRETFGLSLYESEDDLRTMFTSRDPEQTTPQVSWFSLVFEEATAMSFDDLDAMERYGWPVAGDWAYPLAIKVSPEDDFGIPSASELMWLAATLRVLPDFLVVHLDARSGYLRRPAEATYELPEIHGGRQIALRYPVDLLGLDWIDFEEDGEMDEPNEELEDFIADWYWDEASHEFARQLGAFLFDFLDELATTGLSDRTWQKHVDNCWLIGRFVCGYGYYDEFSPEIFAGEPSYLYEFRRKVSDSKYAVASYKATWRKLVRYARSLGDGE